MTTIFILFSYSFYYLFSFGQQHFAIKNNWIYVCIKWLEINWGTHLFCIHGVVLKFTWKFILWCDEKIMRLYIKVNCIIISNINYGFFYINFCLHTVLLIYGQLNEAYWFKSDRWNWLLKLRTIKLVVF